MDINPDFRTQLAESASGDGAGELKLLRAGSYRMSIQFPGGPYHSKHHALEDYDRWDVAVFTMDGTPATPRTHPQLFQHVPWRRYWSVYESVSLSSSSPFQVIVCSPFWNMRRVGAGGVGPLSPGGRRALAI